MNKISIDLEVYTYQIDFAHHVSNIVYIQWMEIGRLKLLEELGMPVYKIDDEGITPILVNTNISYKQPIYFGDKVRLEIWVSGLTFATATLEFRFFKNGNILSALGTQKGLFINLSTKKTHRLASVQRALFEKFMEKQDS